MELTNLRPAISLPTLMTDEFRSVTAPLHSESLVSFTTYDGTPDLLRMTETSTKDLIIYPEWSNGEETYWVLAAGETVEVHQLRHGFDSGLRVRIRSARTYTEEWVTLGGYLRIGRNPASEIAR